MKKSLGISYSTNKYAPEQFGNLHVYGKPFLLDADIRQQLGYIHITKGKAACIAEIKRLYRASFRKHRYCTIGFRLTDSSREYCFCRELQANDEDFRAKLSVYKKFKQFMVEQGCKYEEYTSAELGADYKPEHIETHYRKVDITHPVKIYFVDPKEAKA